MKRRVADRLDQRHVFGGQPRRLAHLAVHHVLAQQPHHANGQPPFFCGRRAQVPQLLEEAAGHVGMDPEGIGTQQGASGDAHRQPVRVVGAQRIGDPARPLPTQIGTRDIAGGRPRCGAHVPGIRGVQITGGLQMFGDQRRILVNRRRVTRFDCGRHPTVHLGAIRLELRFVGDRANQRMVEHILRLSGEPDLIDELGRHQVSNDRFDPQLGQQVEV